MKERIRIAAPVVDNYRWNRHGDEDRLSILTKEAKAELAKLIENLKRINPETTDYGRLIWSFWVDVPKGELEDFGDYKELKAEGIYKNKKEFVADWEKEYPEDTYWHEITVAIEAQFTGLWLDDVCLIRQDLKEEKEGRWPNADYIEFLEFLNAKVDAIVEEVRQGTYQGHLNEALPYKYRTGLINRKRFWELDPKRKEYDIADLTDSEIAEFLKYAAENTDEDGVKGRIPRMSAGKYYEICSWCYTAAKFDGIKGLSPKEMFMMKGDRRDGGLSTLDENDEDAFDVWYDLPDDKKWEIENSSHMWEIRMGHTHTMIHLYLYKDKEKGGYYFTLSGGDHCQTDAIVRMFNTLKQHNIPVKLYRYDLIVKKITGEDDVGIISITDTPWTYWYGGFREDKVLNFDNLREVENVEEIINSTRWFDLPVLTLAETADGD